MISPNPPVEETLVADPRGEWTPSQFVEQKLLTMLRMTPLPISMVHSDRFTGSLSAISTLLALTRRLTRLFAEHLVSSLRGLVGLFTPVQKSNQHAPRAERRSVLA